MFLTIVFIYYVTDALLISLSFFYFRKLDISVDKLCLHRTCFCNAVKSNVPSICYCSLMVGSKLQTLVLVVCK